MAVLGQGAYCAAASARVACNALFVAAAGTIAAFLAGRQLWARAQRWVMGGVLAGLAARLAFDSGRLRRRIIVQGEEACAFD